MPTMLQLVLWASLGLIPVCGHGSSRGGASTLRNIKVIPEHGTFPQTPHKPPPIPLQILNALERGSMLACFEARQHAQVRKAKSARQ